jgi:hypothetical protein
MACRDRQGVQKDEMGHETGVQLFGKPEGKRPLGRP